MAGFKGTREAFAQALLDMAQENDKIMFVSPDSLKAMRATKFAELHPEQYVEVGISEQNAVDTAAGLAAAGLTPFVGTYAGFLTMRACEQMRTFVAYPNLNVKFVGINSGLLGGEREGVTHQFYEDLGILSNIPNYTIFTPADAAQTYHAVKLAAEIDGPVYVRAGSGREADIYEIETPFSEDGIRILKEYGNDTLLLSSGFVLDRVLKAAELLKDKGIQVTVGDVNILYGRNPQKILDAIAKAKQIVTVEDHNVNGGLGAYTSKLVVENDPKYVKRMGLTTFGESGPAKELADAYGFSPENIAKTVEENLK
ncbi:transketolase family protein [Claveliimonas bilis]|uniref:transketolase family protein n=1 Tax=Claveliimonas bilis TaxID=3028070 RepID=UPI001C39D84D|nr:transketolase C-terminal domain-containing protein [Claveliimonas bilis]BDZ79553.1 transketolase [Claveliimonas bilis]HIZ60342.1 transketolase [Candidatus Dorea faecipullorum]